MEAVVWRVDALHLIELAQERLKLHLHFRLQLLSHLLSRAPLVVVPRLAICAQLLLDLTLAVLAVELVVREAEQAHGVEGGVGLAAHPAAVRHDRVRLLQLILQLLPHQVYPQLQYLHHAWVVDAAERLRLGIQGLALLPRGRRLLRLLLVLEFPVLTPQKLLVLQHAQRLPQHVRVDLQVGGQLVLLNPLPPRQSVQRHHRQPARVHALPLVPGGVRWRDLPGVETPGREAHQLLEARDARDDLHPAFPPPGPHNSRGEELGARHR
mmetsp:Transcript_17360/g.44112  ORF Transcript_17360/g.44112 Transcript_17360/m.44112 type:complete len:267 (+) Transcript_17360:839-1639(+)